MQISYYLMHSQKLHFLHGEMTQLVRTCEGLMKGLHRMRHADNINGVISKVYAQNEELEHRIIEEMINKGFLISSDEFYRVNGLDLEHREVFKRDSHQGKELNELKELIELKEQVEEDEQDKDDEDSKEGEELPPIIEETAHK